MTMRLTVVLLSVGMWHSVSAQTPPPIHQRPTTVQALITGSPRLRDGTYQASGKSSICGVIPKLASLTGEALFSVEFPNDVPSQTPGSVLSLSFASRELASGAPTTSRFKLNVSVVDAQGGRPPSYVLITDQPKATVAGTAKLATAAGITTLTVQGRDEAGETINLTVTCR
jgi:hypothetical protein